MRQPEERRCYRCGKCCQDIILIISPEKMEEIRQSSISTENVTNAKNLVFLFEKTICVDGRQTNPSWKYHYRCTRFIPHQDGSGRCAIHKTEKPFMCRVFPFPLEKHEGNKHIEQEFLAKRNYPSHYQGCGYNRDDENPTNERQE
jgi:Fe-S-cluster containining protein